MHRKNTDCNQILIFASKDDGMILPKATLLYFFLPVFAFAQEAIAPLPSPLAMATARYKETYLKVTYSQPHKHGREVFGKLVPFAQVWRTGANQATELTTTRDIQLNGTLLKAGTYSLFTIPEKDKWTIILNSELGLWGSYNYNPKLDVFRFHVPVQLSPGPVYEPFTIQIDQKNDKAEFIMMWDNVKVSFPLQFQEPKP
jgi:Protein of unknown function (DUF2911)